MKIIKNRVNCINYFASALIWIIVFQNPIERVIPVFKYFDECISLIIAAVGVYLLKKQKDILSTDERKYARLILGLLGVVILLGIIGDILNGYSNIYYILIDIVTFSKFFVFVLGFYICSKKMRKKLSTEFILKNIYMIIAAILALFIADLVGRIFNCYIFSYHDIRYGIKSFQLIWSHPTFLASSCIFIICLQLCLCKEYRKKNVFFFLCSIVLVLCTLRTKAIIGLFTGLGLTIYIKIFNRKIKLKEIIFILGFVLILGFQQFYLYFVQYSTDGARSRLTSTSFEIANEQFPFGSGFATYGSATTTKEDNYSELYYKYGLDSIYGLEKDNAIFVSDTFWPTIIGETGYFGLISYAIMIIIIFLFLNEQNFEKNIYCAKLLAFFYLLISSSGESAFFNPISISYALIIALYNPKEIKGEKERTMKIFTCTYAINYNAGPKAQFDIIKILKKYSNKKIKEETIILSPNKGLHNKLLNIIKKIIAFFKIKLTNDSYIIQYPLGSNVKMLKRMVNQKTILFIHDIMGLRFEEDEVLKNELSVFQKSKIIIVHNKKMQEFLKTKGIYSEKVINLELFDYLMSDYENKKDKGFEKTLNVAYVGNLAPEKCPFISMLDQEKMNFNIYLYGKGNTEKLNDKIIYKGSFLPDDLPKFIEGNLGLVWDGNVDDKYINNFMNYSRYNNPHKLSCYIAAELPVIVWEKSAVADLVKKYNIGYTISNLYEINNLDLNEYEEKKKNVMLLSEKVRNGFFTINAYKELLEKLQ